MKTDVMIGSGYTIENPTQGYLKVNQADAQKLHSIKIDPSARSLGTYVIGSTGAGKSTLLYNIITQDIRFNEGVCVIDPHGDLIDDVLRGIPDRRKDDVIIFSPGSPEQVSRPIGLNVFDCDRDDPMQKRLVVSTIIGTLYKLFHYSWGPRMEDLLRVSILTLLEYPEPVTFLDLQLLLSSASHRRRYIDALPENKYVLRQFWDVQFDAYDSRQRVEVVGSSLNKIGRFIVDPLIQNIVCQPENSIDLREVMDEGKILLVNLSKGEIGEENASLLGAVLVNLILIAAMSRREMPKEERAPYHLVVDEFQNFATSSFATLQSEARKYAIDVIVAHQYRDQLDRLSLGATMNVGNIIALRTTGMDSHHIASTFNTRPPAGKVGFRQFHAVSDKPFPQWNKNLSKDEISKLDDALNQVRLATGKELVWGNSIKRQHDESDDSFFTEVVEYPLLEAYEEPRRTYADMQSERANQLSTLANYEAICRLYTPTTEVVMDDEKFLQLWGEDTEESWAEIEKATKRTYDFTEYKVFLFKMLSSKQTDEGVEQMRNASVLNFGLPVEDVQTYIKQRIGGSWDFDMYTTPGFGTSLNADDIVEE